MNKMLAIALNTFREAIRERILYGFLFFAVVLILFTIVLGKLSIGDEIRPTVDIGLAGISFFSALMAIFLGITLLHKEIERRTIYPVLSKPISRASYLIGKFLGLCGTMYTQIVLMTLIWLVVLRFQGAEIGMGVVLAVVLIALETTVVVAMALLFTSFSRPFLSGIFCIGIFAAGRNAELIGQLAGHKGMSGFAPVLESVMAIVPNFYLFYPSGKLVDGAWMSVHSQFISSGYIVNAAGYGLAYTLGLLLISVAILSRRDFI